MILRSPEFLYGHKIKTREELILAIGPRLRKRRVIMCHGTFDLVHPGHIRHFLYAKSKADVLVVSLTSDACITKGDFRPYVPQDLRAMNLAAIEAVDYVIIDTHPTPLENLRLIQPDFFAKGYEYQDGGIHPRTQEEMNVLQEYGGEILFTPGDFVLSSSKYISNQRPNLAPDKLVTLMDSEGVSFTDLRAALDGFRGLRIHVLGDTIIDSYVYCTPISTNTAKTPTLSVRHEQQVDFVGGAAIVAKHLRAAGAEVTFSTVLGDDAGKDFILADLIKHGIHCQAVIDPTRPTTQKHVFIANKHRLLKFDKVDNRPVAGRILDSLRADLSASRPAGFVFSDFRHGIFNRATIPLLTGSLSGGAVRVADSQVASRWGNILEFQEFDLITPNEREARFALGDQDSTIRPLAMELYMRSQCKLLILKMGERGAMAYRAPNPEVRSFFTLDSFAEQAIDPVGAGDALLAYATLAVAAGKVPVVTAVLGSIAAGLACECEGNCPVEPDAIRDRIDLLEKRARFGGPALTTRAA
ncbi:ADP-heptose synthase [Planctomycetaceae bacterium SCGC AG-212-F19]|nr:ADP-heptose synthase [Planctomycetaceae bacterium SCGC AG-212-F19]